MSIKAIMVPFDKDGNMLDYPAYGTTEWRELSTMHATLRYTGYSKGRSAVGFCFEDQEGKKFNMFLSGMDKAIPMFNQGRLTGTFQFIKRGQNYGIELISPL